MNKRMSIQEQPKHSVEECVKSKDNGKRIKMTIEMREVETKELMEDLIELPESFLDWDDQRLKKVDLVMIRWRVMNSA